MLFLSFTILFYSFKIGVEKLQSVGQIWPTAHFLRLGAKNGFTLLKGCLNKQTNNTEDYVTENL